MDPENGPQSPSVGHTDIGLKTTQIASALPEMNNTEDSDLVNENQILRNKNSDRFKSHKIDRFLSPSPVAKAMHEQEGGGISEEEGDGDATSRTTDDSQSRDDWPRDQDHPSDRSIRPQTAPLLNNNNNNMIPVDHRELRNKSVPLSMADNEPNLMLNRSSESGKETLDNSDDKGFTWHPHVYAKPPKQPTPHSISDILGLSLSRTRISSESNVDFYKEESSRHSSMSESSDSEEQFRGDGTGGDQPLNLCLSKSRSEESPRDERRQSGKSSALRKGEWREERIVENK